MGRLGMRRAIPRMGRQAPSLAAPTNHSAIYIGMLKRFGFTLSYDVIEKEVKRTIDGQRCRSRT